MRDTVINTLRRSPKGNKKYLILFIVVCILLGGIYIKITNDRKNQDENYAYFKELAKSKPSDLQEINIMYKGKFDFETHRIDEQDKIYKILNSINDLKICDFKGKKVVNEPSNIICYIWIITNNKYYKGPILINTDTIYYNDKGYKFEKNIGKDFQEIVDELR